MTEHMSGGEAAEFSYLETELPEVEIDRGINNCGGKITDYLEVLLITYRYGQKQLEELVSYWREHDYESFTVRVHAMKSSSLNLGAVQVSDMAKRLESAGRQQDYDYIDANMEAYKEAYSVLLEHINNVLEHYQMAGEPVQDEKDELDEIYLLHILMGIRQCIDEFDFAKVFSMLEEIKRYQLPEEYQEPIAQISAWMDELSVENIQELIGKILEEKEKTD